MRRGTQLKFAKISGWGGRRTGSGRKNRSGEVSHRTRPRVSGRFPLHITCKLRPGLKGLRSTRLHAEFQKCLRKAKIKGLRVLHYSILNDHLHLYVECSSNKDLASGMNSLGSSFGRCVRKQSGETGKVFRGRYHVRALKTPRENRNALAYVLLNRAKHQKVFAYYDPYSSGAFFNDWRRLLGREIGPRLCDWKIRERPLPAYLAEPRSWLAREGWRRAG